MVISSVTGIIAGMLMFLLRYFYYIVGDLLELLVISTIILFTAASLYISIRRSKIGSYTTALNRGLITSFIAATIFFMGTIAMNGIPEGSVILTVFYVFYGIAAAQTAIVALFFRNAGKDSGQQRGSGALDDPYL